MMDTYISGTRSKVCHTFMVTVSGLDLMITKASQKRYVSFFLFLSSLFLLFLYLLFHSLLLNISPDSSIFDFFSPLSFFLSFSSFCSILLSLAPLSLSLNICAVIQGKQPCYSYSTKLKVLRQELSSPS